MSIRKATQEETRAIVGYASVVIKESTVGKLDSTNQSVPYDNSEFLLNGGYYLVYSRKRQMMGWVGVGFFYDDFSREMVGFIPELYVLPPYRKQGIAKQLCEEAIQQIKKMGYRKVQLNVFSGNNAKKLYTKLGFQNIYTLMEKKL